jgi:uncharacterized protein (TIGR00299 family) protein
MSRHLHFDLLGGIAGDMTVAALVDAGASQDELFERLEASGLPVTALAMERTWRGGLAGCCFHVEPEVDPPARSWAIIRQLLQESQLPSDAKALALDIFARLARAEARSHGCAEDDVHFHEVGAMDSIVDIVAVALAIDLLDVGSASCSAIPICQGSVRTAHGMLPLPAPATARLLQGFTLTNIPGSIETVTPTGAAVLAALCSVPEDSPPSMRLLSTGMGMGQAQLPDRPNVLRVLLGEVVSSSGDAAGTDAVVIEASIDDMDPRIYGAVASSLFEAGALDVALLPLQMKKGRPGTLMQVVCRPELEGVLTGIVLRETTTLGVRSHDVRRVELARTHHDVDTRFGTVRIKCGTLGDELLNTSPEYEDCAQLAHQHGVPLKDVLAAAAAAAEETLRSDVFSA